MEQKKSTQKRLQLLNAALDVFSLYGFNGASLDEIAQIAEMHKSNIFYYYENKEALYVEVLTTVKHATKCMGKIQYQSKYSIFYT